MQVIAANLDGPIQYTQEFEAYTQPKNNTSNGARYKNTLRDDSGFIWNAQLEKMVVVTSSMAMNQEDGTWPLNLLELQFIEERTIHTSMWTRIEQFIHHIHKSGAAATSTSRLFQVIL